MDDQPKPARDLLPGDERNTKQLVPGRLRFLQIIGCEGAGDRVRSRTKCVHSQAPWGASIRQSQPTTGSRDVIRSGASGWLMLLFDGRSKKQQGGPCMAISLKYLLVEDAPPVAIITLNRPDQLNALSTGLMEELTAELERQASRPEVRAIVIKGAGRAFSAGHDLKEMLDKTLDEERELFALCNKLMAKVQSVPVPVIAAPHGIATAAGCQLVATCDLAIASDDCRFATSGVRYGLFCSTPGVAVARNVGRKNAMEMLLTGDFIDAATAVEWGLINRAVPRERLDDEVMVLVNQLAQHSRYALQIGKEGFYRQIESTQPKAYEMMAEAISRIAKVGRASCRARG